MSTRPGLILHHHHHPPTPHCEEACARLVAPLTLWICASVIVRYGFYANRSIVLGPSSSRLFEANSLFVQHIEVKDREKKGVFLYGYSEKPELILEENWSVSNYLIISSYGRKGFSLWLNKGSRIRMTWAAKTNILDQLDVSITKGERNYETLIPSSTSPNAHSTYEPILGIEAMYAIEEDDKYYISIVNTKRRGILISMKLNVSSKIHDTSKANSICSTLKGSCQLKLPPFPETRFMTVSTHNDGDLGQWNVYIAFTARLLTYIAILVVFMIVILLMLKYLGAWEVEEQEQEGATREVTEVDPLLPEKPLGSPYGTGGENVSDAVHGTSTSSEDLYDEKICVICYEKPRNCFFIPCGHSATCFTCAQRIMDGDTKVCPICRRLIHKLRKLAIP